MLGFRSLAFRLLHDWGAWPGLKRGLGVTETKRSWPQEAWVPHATKRRSHSAHTHRRRPGPRRAFSTCSLGPRAPAGGLNTGPGLPRQVLV